jgi:hypothetical protein
MSATPPPTVADLSVDRKLNHGRLALPSAPLTTLFRNAATWCTLTNCSEGLN